MIDSIYLGSPFDSKSNTAFGCQHPRPECVPSNSGPGSDQFHVETRKQRRQREQDLLFRKMAPRTNILPAAVRDPDSGKSIVGKT